MFAVNFFLCAGDCGLRPLCAVSCMAGPPVAVFCTLNPHPWARLVPQTAECHVAGQEFMDKPDVADDRISDLKRR